MLATPPPVPVSAQHAIVQRTALYAYVPARVGIGYRFLRWQYTAKPQPVLRVFFRNKAGRELTFVASQRFGPCSHGKEKTFQLAGNKVFWSHTAQDQQAWRCVTGSGDRQVQLTAATSQPTTMFADVGLGRIASSGRRIR